MAPYFVSLEALGKQKEDFVIAAQSKAKNAHAASKAAAFNLFRTQLEEDTASYEALKIRPVNSQPFDLHCFFKSDPNPIDLSLQG